MIFFFQVLLPEEYLIAICEVDIEVSTMGVMHQLSLHLRLRTTSVNGQTYIVTVSTCLLSHTWTGRRSKRP